VSSYALKIQESTVKISQILVLKDALIIHMETMILELASKLVSSTIPLGLGLNLPLLMIQLTFAFIIALKIDGLITSLYTVCKTVRLVPLQMILHGDAWLCALPTPFHTPMLLLESVFMAVLNLTSPQRSEGPV